ncbi:hypothetical protein BDQ12DRAFT_604911 [Crucibulum laeve]|uniref:Zn(2)-C6 fungal-type domain-containing protein n=1 Tax=Crucibulum laeve TaxID=68775 RepID=A0A5C3M3U8_9AGAR|nr:hypothetical protein BDQ12DRAFT_604911 [Crucibulum laeve]
MSPSVATRELVDQDQHPRPLKRPRKSAPPKPREEELQFANTAPLDHIFITDGLVTKKPAKKAPLSCCECRRLKLKCDRNFPCASCKKRGCAEICPDGVLVSGKGTRFILANTEQLHTKIHDMSDRIRSLEEALVKLQSQSSPDPHPLMHPDLLGIKSTMGLYSGAQVTHDASGSGSDHGQNGHAHTRPVEQRMEVGELGDRGSSEDTLMGELSPQVCFLCYASRMKQEGVDSLAAEIARLSNSFPLSDKVSPLPNLPMREYIRSQLPSQAEAEYLWEQARQNALWQ